MNNNEEAIYQVLKSLQYLIEQSLKRTTKIYDGLILSKNGDKWMVLYNNEKHLVSYYGKDNPKIDSVVKVIVPQGNQNLAWFF